MSTEIGIIFVILLVSTAGLLAGRKVHSTSDFLTGGGRASSWLTTGALTEKSSSILCATGTFISVLAQELHV